jgi:hypothetical protein
MTRAWKIIALVAATVLVTAGVTTAFAGRSSNDGTASGKSVTQVKEIWHTHPSIGAAVGDGWIEVAHSSIKVSSGSHAIIDVTADVSGYCEAAAAASLDTSCGIRVLIGGHEAKPVNASEVAVAAPNSTTEGQWTIERSSLPLGAGSYPVVVQHEALGDTDGYFGVLDWHIRIDRIAV